MSSSLKEDADELKNEWKKDAEEGERDLDGAHKDADDRVRVACSCDVTPLSSFVQCLRRGGLFTAPCRNDVVKVTVSADAVKQSQYLWCSTKFWS